MARPQQLTAFVHEADHEASWRAAVGAGMISRGKRPLNCELPPARLGGDVTPSGRFFHRNHFPIPVLDPGAWRLDVGGLVGTPLVLSLADLRELPAQTLTVTLECAGNGRVMFTPPAEGERWELGAVSTARWTGARLSDVLDRAGVQSAAREVVFRGADGGPVARRRDPVRFERSLPVAAATRSGALLAYEMNGEPLPVEHGQPVRLIVPGWYAVASVKWLTEIEVTGEPFRGYFQDDDYMYEWQRDGHRVREPVGLQRVRAMVVEPAAGQQVAAGDMRVTGVAWSGAAPVTKVEVRVTRPGGDDRRDGDDGQQDWQPARLTGDSGRFGWRQWETTIPGVPRGPVRVQARAVDAAGNDQLAEPEWNRLGYGGNFVHAVVAAAA
jgi:DMSO/TMAO reductase YedYZ molybdopterin-dependent catalytic subunit